MKKITSLSSLQKKFLQINLAVMLLLTTSLFGQDVLLGQYEFTTGANQLKASSVTDGITMGDLVIDPTKLTLNYSSDAIEISNWTGMNIAGGKCINVPVTKSANASEFNISRIDIVLKRTTANKIQINFGPTVNTATYKTYATSTLLGSSSYFTYALNENTNTGNTGTTVTAIPAKTDANTLYLSIGTVSATTSEVVYFDKIEVWGTVSLIATPTVTSNISQKTISSSKNHSVTFPVVLSGDNLTQATSVSIIGADAANFSKDVSSISAVDFNASNQTVNVTYAASAITYNSSTRLHTPHTATLRIENPDATTVDVALTATCDVLFEDFSNYDATAISSTTLAVLRTIPDNLPLSLVSGWAGDQLYEYKAGSPNLGTVCLGSTNTDSAYLTTPELDLSQPFDLFFKARSLNAGSDGNFKVFVDGNQLMYDSINTTNSLKRYESAAFVGTSASKLTFTGRQVDLNEIIVDSIVVNYSTKPALNIPLNKTENFGTIVPGSQTTVNIPIKGYNLTGDLTIIEPPTAAYELLSGTTITEAAAESEGGAVIQIRFSPVGYANYNDNLVITGGGLAATGTNGNRTINLTGVGGGATFTVNTAGNASSLTDCASCNLEITNEGHLTVDVAKTYNSIVVAPQGKLTVASGIQLSVSGNLTLQSGSTGTASLIDNGTLLVSGTTTVQQYLTAQMVPLSADNWWYIASPVTGGTSAGILVEGYNNQFGYYNEPTANYPQITTTNVSLNPGKGYLARINTTGIYSFTGTLNNGNVGPVTLTRTPAAAGKRGFNLVGNPYPSHINWNALTGYGTQNSRTDIRPTVWVRTRMASGAMGFDTFDGQDGVWVGVRGANNQYIAPMQAFWVKVNEDNTTPTITFTNAMRTVMDQSTNNNRLRTPVQTSRQILRLELNNGLNTDQMIISTNEASQNGYDFYDSEKMSANTVDVAEIYSLVADQELVINKRQSINVGAAVILGFRPGQTGTFSIRASELTNMEHVKVILKDHLLNNETELTGDNSYEFTADATATNDRFSVEFRSPGALTAVDDDISSANALVFVNATNQITVQSAGLVNGDRIRVLNLAGKELVSCAVLGQSTVVNQQLSAGVYIVKVNNKIHKVVIK